MSAQKTSKITVLLEPSEADRFEAYCNLRGFKKSTLIARLVRDHLDKEQFQRERSTAAGTHGVRARR